MSGFVKLFFCVSFRWTDPLKSTCMPHSSCSCCVISVFLYRYMISVSFSTLQPGTYTHETLCAHVCVCMCVRLCMFFIMWYGGFARWCYSTGRIALSCLMLLAMVCASVCVPTVSTHVPFRMPFSCVYAHVRACSAAHVLWYHVVFDVLVQVRFGRFLRKIEECWVETIQVGPTSEFDSRATHLHKQTHTRSHTCAHAHTRHSGVAPQMSFAAPRQRTPMQIFFLFFSSLVCQKTFLSFFSASPSASLCMCASLASLTHTRKHQELESGSVKKKKRNVWTYICELPANPAA